MIPAGVCVLRGRGPMERWKMPDRQVKDPKEVVVILKVHMRPDADGEAYRRTSRRMHELVERLPGFISLREYTSEDGEVINLARFTDEGALQDWKKEPEHLEAQRQGREAFYDHYWFQTCRVIREYEFWLDGVDPAGPEAGEGRAL